MQVDSLNEGYRTDLSFACTSSVDIENLALNCTIPTNHSTWIENVLGWGRNMGGAKIRINH